MSKLYPTANNSIDNYGLSVLGIRENKVYPTIHNEKYDYGLSSFKIRQ